MGVMKMEVLGVIKRLLDGEILYCKSGYCKKARMKPKDYDRTYDNIIEYINDCWNRRHYAWMDDANIIHVKFAEIFRFHKKV